MPEKRQDTTQARPAEGTEATPPTEPEPELIAEGGRLVEALDRDGVAPAVAFWLWFRDVRGFRLILSGGGLATGPLDAADRRVKRVLGEHRSFDRLNEGLIGVRPPEARVVAAVRDAVSTGPGLHGIRIRDNVVGGVRLQRAYIYRSS